jgi:hypothetical protein
MDSGNNRMEAVIRHGLKMIMKIRKGGRLKRIEEIEIQICYRSNIRRGKEG